MKLNLNDKFIASWVPETINGGQENLNGQSVLKKGLWDEKSHISRNKKTGELYMVFYDRDKKNYITANADIVSITMNIFQGK